MMLILSKEQKFANDSSAVNRNGLKVSPRQCCSQSSASWRAGVSGGDGDVFPANSYSNHGEHQTLFLFFFSHQHNQNIHGIPITIWWEKPNSFTSQWKRHYVLWGHYCRVFSLSESRRGERQGFLFFLLQHCGIFNQGGGWGGGFLADYLPPGKPS